ncbi:MAG: hypothetical protein WBQ23_02435, partial [Bacteroidota bacterium]
MTFNRTYLRSFICVAILAVGLMPGLHAQPAKDILTHSPLGSNGCYSFSLQNANAQKLEIDKLQLRILTPGSYWYLRVKPPASWIASLPVPETMQFTGTANPVQPGGKLVLNNICLDPICQTASTIAVLWQTFNGTTVLTSDTLWLTCIPLSQLDELTYQDSSGTFLLTLHNQNSMGVSLDGFSIRSVTPGISFTTQANNDWIIGTSSSTSASFVKTVDPLLVGDSLPGFALTLTIGGSAVPPYVFEWSTTSELRTISQADLLIGKGQPMLDSIRVYSLPRPPGGRFNPYALTILNRHRPSGPIDKLELQLHNSGIAFADSNSGPWTTAVLGDSTLRFSTTAAALLSQDSLPGFRFALTNAGSSDSVAVIWLSSYQGHFICRDTIMLYCPPTEYFGCDNFALLMDKSCVSSIHISNRHEPKSPVNGFRFEIVSGTESIISVVPPPGWQTDSSTGSVARFSSSGTGLTPGNVSLPFDIAFTSVQAGKSFSIRWSTFYNGRMICQEDRSIVCSGVETACDSLLITTDGVRDFTYSVKNMHLPVSNTTAVSFRVSSGNSKLQLTAAPAAPWLADSVGTGFIRFVNQGGGVPAGDVSSGFDLSFIENSATDVTLDWCSEDSNGVICCQTIAVALPEWGSCDSIAVSKNSAACSAGITLRNMNGGQLPVDQLSVSITTPGREIDTIIAPAGWNAVRVDAQNISFMHTSGGLPAGAVQSGFIVRLLPIPAGGDVAVEICTWNSGRSICCQQELLPCAAEQTGGCDSISIMASASCCFELDVLNLRGPGSLVDSVYLRVLTPDVILYQSTVESPIGWLSGGTETEVSWSTATIPIANGFSLAYFKLCFDNDATGNAPFLVEVNTFDRSEASCADTLQVQCDQTLVVGGSTTPADFALEQNYPNPFNPSTTIAFGLPQSEYITLEILDARGKLLSTLVDGFQQEGRHRVVFNASDLPSGVY